MSTKSGLNNCEFQLYNASNVKKVEPKGLSDFQYLPSQLELALISSIAYPAIEPQKSYELELERREWMKIASGTHSSGYGGVCYLNKRFGQLVIAHKGTNSLKDLWNDVSLLFKHDNVQVSPAYDFTKRAIKLFGPMSTSVIITGHSLGAWLAQVTGFFIQYPLCAPLCTKWEEYIPHVHVIGFDSPGAYGAISKYHEKAYDRHSAENGLHNLLIYLDCTLYLCNQNLVNVVDKHIGSAYIMEGVNNHRIKSIVSFWEKPKAHDQLQAINDWSHGHREFCLKRRSSLVPLNKDTIGVSHFSLKEIKFLEIVHSMAEYVKKESIDWDSLVSTNGKRLKIQYDTFHSFSFDDSRLRIKITGDHDTFVRTIKFINYKLHDNFFKNTPTINRVIKMGFSEAYAQNILILKDSIQLGNIINIRNFILEKLSNTKRPMLFKIESKSPCIVASCIFHLFKQHQKIYFIDSKNLSTISLAFPQRVHQILHEGSISVLVIQVNSSLEQIDSLFSHQPKISIFLLTCCEVEFKHTFDGVFECLQKIYYKDLNEQSKNKFRNKVVTAPPTCLTIKNIVEISCLENLNLNDFDDLLENKCIKIGQNLPVLSECQKSYYIERKFYLNTLTKYPQQVFRNMEMECSVFQLTRTENEVSLDLLPLEKPTNVSIDRPRRTSLVGSLIGSSKKTKQKSVKIENISTVVHEDLLQKINSELKDRYCRNFYIIEKLNGNSYVLHSGELPWGSTRETEHDFIREIDLHERLLFGVRIIAGEPGIGKSTFLANFIEILRRMQKFIFHMDLKTCAQIVSSNLPSFGSVITEEDSLNIFYRLNASAEKMKPSYRFLMKHALQNSVILIDGYDEICRTLQENIKRFICSLKQFNPTIYIFSRLRERRVLEIDFGVIANRPIPLNKNEQVEFLQKFWSHKLEYKEFLNAETETNCKKTLQIYANQLLNKFANYEITESVMGIPLQLFMLGSISFPNLMKMLKNQEVEETFFSNVFQLIEQFVLQKYKIMLKEKEQIGNFLEDNYIHKNIIKRYDKIHSIISFAYLFPAQFSEVTEFKANEMLDADDINQLQRIGIIYEVDFENGRVKVQEIHRLILEYFCAKFIVQNLSKKHKKQKQVEFLKKVFTQKSFEHIRLAVDYLLTTKSKYEIFGKIVLCKDSVKTKLDLTTGVNTDCTDLLGRNIMHYLMAYMKITSNNEGLLRTLNFSGYTELVMTRDSMGVYPLNYLVLNPIMKNLEESINFPLDVDFDNLGPQFCEELIRRDIQAKIGPKKFKFLLKMCQSSKKL